jgi:hypothetical protein
MTDTELPGRLLRLADAIRETPETQTRAELVAAFEALVWHLEKSGQIHPVKWVLTPRGPAS